MSNKSSNEGVRLKRMRDAAGFSQEQLAEQLGVSRMTIIRWEQADVLPKGRLEEVASFLGADLSAVQAEMAFETPGYVRNIDDALEWWTRISIMDLDVFARLIMGILATSEFMDRATGIVAFTEDDLVKRGNLPSEIVERCLPAVLESPWIERLGNAKYAVKLKMPPAKSSSEK